MREVRPAAAVRIHRQKKRPAVVGGPGTRKTFLEIREIGGKPATSLR
jgi:hypothetical protein